MSASDEREVQYGTRGPEEKWDLLAPPLEAARNTGYLRAVDLTTEELYGLRATRETVAELDQRFREARRPGFYSRILREVANVDRCHVNSLVDEPFWETEMPELFDQDLSLVPLVYGVNSRAEELSEIEVAGLDDYLVLIEWCFDRYGDRAVAVKCPWAYGRPLAVTGDDSPPRRAFTRLRRGNAGANDRRRVEDFLFDRCVRVATDYGLPVKLHLGYLAGNRRPQLPWVFDHMADTAAIVARHPEARFVLFHMAWPQQEQLLAIAKHHPNVWVDLCWVWTLAPLSGRDFVQRFLTTVAASKLLCFGGDYTMVENVVGHARLARWGLQSALQELVSDGWLTTDGALGLVDGMMRGNALELFGDRSSGDPQDSTGATRGG